MNRMNGLTKPVPAYDEPGRRPWKRIVSYIVGALLMVITVVFQSSFFPRFPFFGATPDVFLAVCLCIAFFGNERQGMIFGEAGGFLIDLLMGTGFSVLPLFYTLATLLLGTDPGTNEGYKTWLPFMKASLIGCGARVILTLFLQIVRRQFSFVQTVFRTMLPEFVGTVLWCLIIGSIIMLLRFVRNRNR